MNGKSIELNALDLYGDSIPVRCGLTQITDIRLGSQIDTVLIVGCNRCVVRSTSCDE